MGWACSVMNQGEGRWLCPAPAGACWASHLAPVSVNYCNPTWGCQVDEFPCTGFCVGRKTGGGRRGLEADASLSSKVTKRMAPPSSPSPKRTALCFVAADLLFALKRRKHRKTCVGDKKKLIFKSSLWLFKAEKFTEVLYWLSRNTARLAAAELPSHPTLVGWQRHCPKWAFTHICLTCS